MEPVLLVVKTADGSGNTVECTISYAQYLYQRSDEQRDVVKVEVWGNKIATLKGKNSEVQRTKNQGWITHNVGEEMVFETKKDEIIHMALADPWLHIKEIADQVGTSEKYVKKILSEQGISLTKQRRKEYEATRRVLSKLRRRVSNDSHKR